MAVDLLSNSEDKAAGFSQKSRKTGILFFGLALGIMSEPLREGQAVAVQKSLRSVCFALISFFLALPYTCAYAQQEEEKEALLLYFTEEELQVVSATRSLKPISNVAENMTVITAADIERMNAHSLAEVLDTVTGIQTRYAPHTPGNQALLDIQGAGAKYATIIIDGVVMNQLSNNMTDIGIIPVQFIERIEIIKGPASSSWGSALGGVINVITKGPPDKGVSGMASVSYGSNNTEDYRAEIRGRQGDLGIYLSAGSIHSNGLVLNSDVRNNYLYSKFTYMLNPGTDLRMGLYYLKSDRGLGHFSYQFPGIEFNEKDRDKKEQYFGTVALTSRITNELTLDIYGSAKGKPGMVLSIIMICRYGVTTRKRMKDDTAPAARLHTSRERTRLSPDWNMITGSKSPRRCWTKNRVLQRWDS
jgi:outer membrane receptor protein involved in Fe transport